MFSWWFSLFKLELATSVLNELIRITTDEYGGNM